MLTSLSRLLFVALAACAVEAPSDDATDRLTTGETPNLGSIRAPAEISWQVVSALDTDAAAQSGQPLVVDVSRPGTAVLFYQGHGAIDFSQVTLVDQVGAHWAMDTWLEVTAEEASTSAAAIAGSDFSLVGPSTPLTTLTDQERDQLVAEGTFAQPSDGRSSSRVYYLCGYVVSGGKVVGLIWCAVKENPV